MQLLKSSLGVKLHVMLQLLETYRAHGLASPSSLFLGIVTAIHQTLIIYAMSQTKYVSNLMGHDLCSPSEARLFRHLFEWGRVPSKREDSRSCFGKSLPETVLPVVLGVEVDIRHGDDAEGVLGFQHFEGHVYLGRVILEN